MKHNAEKTAIIQQFRDNLAAYEAEVDPADISVILWWNNGLSVRWFPDGKTSAVGVLGAEAWADVPAARAFLNGSLVRNGEGKAAILRSRQTCIADSIFALKRTIEWLESN